LPIKTFTSADGLGASFVDFLMRDSRGFMWFCTRDGLSRFDGSHFITYRIGDAAAPPGIESISETHDGTYWIGTTGGFYRFRSSTLSRPDFPSGTRPTLNAEFVSSWRGDFWKIEPNLWL
jgi:ligand-binding sensor domain-containing protein